ncbi:MAG: transketolase [Candidatus Solincola sediminis]|uniref:Transketolase n=1 Tax=Candidatus Solincola sediminis TaxID=1797199 RepID=A0A1F2WPG3_9ACTN|nr:MAG: transketolase [Candidatus Solincola sediminis]
MIGLAKSGHPGGSLSCVEALVCLYFYKMNHNPKAPDWPLRDRFVLSKGHAAPALYAVLAKCGYFERDELWQLRKLGGMLQGHPDIRTPGIEVSTGSLGQGLSIATGIAVGLRMEKSNCRVYAIIGDGESQEGGIWEGAMLAGHQCLNNLTVIMDNNGMQIDGNCCDIVNLGDQAAKWRAFDWDVQEVDGHDVVQICEALDSCGTSNRPSIIIARTVKGKGVSFMENNVDFHGKAPTPEEMERALKEIEHS